MFQSVPSASRPAGSLSPRKRWQAAALALVTSGVLAMPAQAQFAYQSANAAIATSGYAALGANGTAISVANNDDANSAAQNIGFAFNYDGQAFTQFVFNTNGFIKLGSTAPSAVDLYYTDPQMYTGTTALESTDPADINIIAPFNYDLEPGTGAVSFKMATTGTAPNQICTIEWANVSDKTLIIPKQYGNMSFQVKLYETSNRIEFVYGPTSAAAGTTPAFLGAVGGLTGATPATEALVITKASSALWRTAMFQDTLYDGQGQNRLNFRSDVRPGQGLTYRFSPEYANDAAVVEIYSLGKLAIPFGAPHAASAAIINRGTAPRTALVVTLTVGGVTTFTNTQTIASLAVGDTAIVTFASYTPTTGGMNTLTVSVPADDNTTNNSRLWMQQVTGGTFSYAENAPASGGVGYNAGSGLIGVKFTTMQSEIVRSARVYLYGAETIGNTVYAVVLDDAGAILDQSADLVVSAADTGSYYTFDFPNQPNVLTGDFYVALAQTAGTPGYFPVGTQDESPARTGAYYAIDLMGGTPTDITTFGLDLRPMIEATLGTGVGLNASRLTRAVSVYPNPSAGRLNVQIAETGATRVALRVLDNLGRVVYTNSMSDNTTKTVDLSTLSNGLYTVQVTLDNQVVTKQVNVQK